MCGFIGIFDKHKKFDLENLSKKLINCLNHRGPDASNFIIDKELSFTLIHNRLKVLDLSDNANQPMKLDDLTIIYNGEIYNHLELRKKIQLEFNVKFKTSSDTETLIYHIKLYGISETLKSLNGMFAFAVLDKSKNKLTLCRDRVGEKPLYYGFLENLFVFGSELSFLSKISKQGLKIRNQSVFDLIKYNYVPTPNTIYENFYKLSPGSFLEYNLNKELNDFSKVKEKKYFFFKKKNLNYSFNHNFLSQVNQFDKIFTEVVNNQSNLSDVNVGCFLSGGIDSSLVASIMQKCSNTKINTFTVGFKDKKFDESIYSKKISEIIGTNHHEHILNKQDIIDAVNLVPKVYSEPFADSSQLPTILLSKFVSNSDTKVVLTGDGGDELFYGYNRYFYTKFIVKFIKFFPKFLSKNLSSNLKLLGLINKIGKLTNYNLTDKFYKSLELLNCRSIEDVYKKLISNSIKNEIFKESQNYLNNSLNFSFDQNSNKIDQMSYFDKTSYLHDDILCKVDRASMFYSIETRCPFLDIDIINFSESIPSQFKLNMFSGKKILKEALSTYVPRKYFERPKMGFGIPLENLIKNELLDFSEEMLSKKSIQMTGIFNFDEINKIWTNHKNGLVSSHYSLWPILMYQNWFLNNR